MSGETCLLGAWDKLLRALSSNSKFVVWYASVECFYSAYETVQENCAWVLIWLYSRPGHLACVSDDFA